MNATARTPCALAIFILSGCAVLTPATPTRIEHEPRAEATALGGAPAAVALVLSGGSARGFAHIGVIKVLEQAGIRPDLVVGASAGSIVGALYASGMRGDELERAAGRADSSLVGDYALTLYSLGVVRGERLREFINVEVKGRLIEQLPLRFAAVAANLRTGELIAFNHGDTGQAVRASSAIPGVFEPVRVGGRLYADGGLVSPLPVATARAMGARTVIAVDVVYPPADSAISSPLAVLFQTFLIQTYRLKEMERSLADVVIAPVMHTSGQLGFSDRAKLIAAGEDAAISALPVIRAALAAAAIQRESRDSR